MTVMIVDDSTEMRSLLRDVVSSFADEVVECVDGEDFLARYDTCKPDWTVMDVRMPWMDGLSATRAIRTRDPQARVLLMTQFPSEAMLTAAAAAGAVCCLAKEDVNQLVEMLNPAVKTQPSNP